MQTIPLSRATLPLLRDDVAVPDYDPAGLRPGIVHLGLGGFARAHLACYTHDLMDLDAAALDWGIVGVGLLPADARLREALLSQDCLYTLVERDGVVERTSVIGSLCDIIGPEAALDAIDAARIVSLTVTGHGYCLDSAKRLDPAHPAIVADLADPLNPSSAIGVVAEGYRRRMASGARAFTALSCDNIQHNGQVLRRAVLDYAALRERALAVWIAEHARFPCTMVDRITPVPQADDIGALTERTGIADACPVFCETFAQWVIEDDFADGRPAWDRAGAQFVRDVAPYETMKLRLLNASHLAIAGPARLMGYTIIDAAMRDPLLREYMIALMERETGPTLQPVPGVDLAEYKAKLIARFANSTIRDTVERINTDAPIDYLLDPVRDRLAAGQGIDLLAFAVAAWLRRMRGVDEAGAAIDIRHPLAALLRDKAVEGGADPRPMLGIAALFGDLGRDPAFVGPVGRWLAALYEKGAAATLEGLRVRDWVA